MSHTIIRGIAIIVASIVSVIFISILNYFFELNDRALIMTLVAMTSSANAIGIYLKLESNLSAKTQS